MVLEHLCDPRTFPSVPQWSSHQLLKEARVPFLMGPSRPETKSMCVCPSRRRSALTLGPPISVLFHPGHTATVKRSECSIDIIRVRWFTAVWRYVPQDEYYAFQDKGSACRYSVQRLREKTPTVYNLANKKQQHWLNEIPRERRYCLKRFFSVSFLLKSRKNKKNPSKEEKHGWFLNTT